MLFVNMEVIDVDQFLTLELFGIMDIITQLEV